ncbi:hypothetical protein Peur_019102 [Populus x canadensis]
MVGEETSEATGYGLLQFYHGLFNSSLIMVITLLLDLTLDKEIRSGCTSLASLKGTHFRTCYPHSPV